MEWVGRKAISSRYGNCITQSFSRNWCRITAVMTKGLRSAPSTVVYIFAILSSASAQDYTQSTMPTHVTAYKQALANFTVAILPSFSCDKASGDAFTDELSSLITDVFEYFLYSTYSLTGCTICDVPKVPEANVSAACTELNAQLQASCKCY